MNKAGTLFSPSDMPKKRERVALLSWLAFVLMFFVIQAIIWTVAISITVSDTSHAVIQDYDRQSLRWDEVKAQQSQSKKLGWDVFVEVSSPDEFKSRSLSLRLTDRLGNPVTGGLLEANVFHRGHAAEVEVLRFFEQESGKYVAEVRMQHGGYWRIDGSLVKDDDVRLINETFFAQ